jgi:hypothetical protein
MVCYTALLPAFISSGKRRFVIKTVIKRENNGRGYKNGLLTELQRFKKFYQYNKNFYPFHFLRVLSSE